MAELRSAATAEGLSFSPSMMAEGAPSSFSFQNRSNMVRGETLPMQIRSNSKLSGFNSFKEVAAASPENAHWVERPPSATPPAPWGGISAAAAAAPAAAASPAAAPAAEGGPISPPLLPSRDITSAACCGPIAAAAAAVAAAAAGAGAEGSPQLDIHPSNSNLHALIPSKFKYKFPRERMPRHSSYEVLAVEDNPYAAPLPPPPPKQPHKKKSIFGIAKRMQQPQQQQNMHLMKRPDDLSAAAAAAAAGEEGAAAAAAAAAGGKGWMHDFRCFLCTSADYVSDEQTQLEVEKNQLEEALIEFQAERRTQSLRLLQLKSECEKQIEERAKEYKQSADQIQETKEILKQIQRERDLLLKQQQQ